MQKSNEINKKEIEKILIDKLCPVYQERFCLVQSIDSLFYHSTSGEAELLNMALISDFVKRLPSDMALKRIHDDYFSTLAIHSGCENFLRSIRKSGWNIDFNQQNFRRLIHYFAQDAGVDSFYNAIDSVDYKNAPIDRFGNIKNWEDMKHSQVLFADIPHYYINGTSHIKQRIAPEKVLNFCNQQKNKLAQTTLNINYANRVNVARV